MKCNYCFFTSQDKAKMERHIESCPFNPNKKNCCSCGNSRCNGIYDLDCAAGREDCRIIFENNLSCPSWTEEKK